MSAFPDLIGTSYQRTPLFKTNVTRFGGNHFVRYRKRIRPRWLFQLGWNLLTKAEAESIETHILTVEDTYFEWFDFRPFAWTQVPVGIGNGTATTFDIPGKETATQLFYFDGVTPAGTSSVVAGAGPNDEDQVTFTVAPISGTPISAAFTGRRRFTVTFGGARQEIDHLLDFQGFFSYSTALYEVK